MKLNFIGNNRGNWTIWSVVDFFFPIKKRLRMEARSFYDGARVSREFYTFRALYTHCFYSLFITPIKDIIKLHRLNPILAQRGAIAFDAASSAENSGNTTSLSYSHTCTGSNLVLLVGLMGGNLTGIGITYNSVSMTTVTSQNASYPPTYLCRLVNPATGANTVAASWTDSGRRASGAISFSGANTTTPIGTTATFFSTAGNSGGVATVTATTDTNNSFVVDVLCNTQVTSTLATTGGNTQRGQRLAFNSSGYDASMSTLYKATAGSVTMSWNFDGGTSNRGYSILFAEVHEALSITSSFFQLL